MPINLGIWRNAHINRVLKKVTAGEQSAEGLPIEVAYELAGIGVPYVVDYLIQNDGTIRITASIDLSGRDLPELPRFGMRMQLPGGYKTLSYYGRGPWENYTDRNTSSFVSRYSDKVENQASWNYIRPQESGYKTDVRWLKLVNDQGRGLLIEGLQPICFSATNNMPEDLDPGLTKKQQHLTDVKPRKEIYVNIDLRQRGVGGDNSWGRPAAPAIPPARQKVQLHIQHRAGRQPVAYGKIMMRPYVAKQCLCQRFDHGVCQQAGPVGIFFFE